MLFLFLLVLSSAVSSLQITSLRKLKSVNAPVNAPVNATGRKIGSALIEYVPNRFLKQNSTFVFTRSLYNGTVTYDGMFYACNKEYFNSMPCNSFNLLKGFFWKGQYSTSWIISLENYDWQGNCQAYTTDDQGNMGACLMAKVPYVTQCSCDEYFPICCYRSQLFSNEETPLNNAYAPNNPPAVSNE